MSKRHARPIGQDGSFNGKLREPCLSLPMVYPRHRRSEKRRARDLISFTPRLADELRTAVRANKSALLMQLPRYRWLIVEPGGPRREVCVQPDMTHAQVATCYIRVLGSCCCRIR